MEILDNDIFLQTIKEIEESPTTVIPDGMTEEEFHLMWQVLTATKPSELEHISNEQLVQMFSFVDNIAEITSKRSVHFDCSTGGTYGFLSSIAKLPSAASSRRVL